ncbi:MAG: glycoside hydrolase family 57 protein [Gammaproteobacteria bacterium]|nr:glycoside hydrolase family 57 protein [Gammaproteobacteria bacterium]
MSAEPRLKVVLCWHMHQPVYRDLITQEYQLPWTYLHAIKDYADMAALLEATPAARVVVNFAPILLEQISDYAHQIKGFITSHTPLHDPLLAALGAAKLPEDDAARVALIKACLRVNRERLIDPFPQYRRLVEIATHLGEDSEALRYLGEQYFADLLMWYHLAWLGETVRRNNTAVRALIEKGYLFTLSDRHTLLSIIAELLGGLIGRYRKLAECGQVELSLTPYAHPIMPLMLDFNSAREAMPDVSLPQSPQYPGAEERVRWHIQQGIEVFRRHFGFTPQGCWPSEGGVSDATLRLLDEYGFRWAASGETVLYNSLARHNKAEPTNKEWLYQPYTVDASNVATFFRDDGLSDLIGFTYAKWHADDAVSNLISHLDSIASTHDTSNSVVSIILDGENAWEYYPYNGYYFLSALYERLSMHPRLHMTTFSDCLDSLPPAEKLETLVAGSWVYGTFSTWIGDDDKNLAWDRLCDAKRAFDTALASGRLTDERRAALEKQLAVCEGSDWFWWFGGYNPADTVSDFELLFRRHLANLYRLLGESIPEELSLVLSRGSGAPAQGGVMRPGQEAQ